MVRVLLDIIEGGEIIDFQRGAVISFASGVFSRLIGPCFLAQQAPDACVRK